MTIELEEGESAADVDAIKSMPAAEDRRVFILDLPLEEMKETASAVEDDPALLFDIRHPDTELRRRTFVRIGCSTCCPAGR